MNDTPDPAAEVDHAIIHLHIGRHWSKRQVAKELGVSRNKVKRVIRTYHARRAGLSPAEDKPATTTIPAGKITPWLDDISELLDEYPNITAVRVLEELRAKGFDGGATIVKQAVRTLRGGRKPTPVVRFETEPGEQGQMDWSLCNIPFVGGKRKMKCFSYILGYSRRQYVAFCEREDFFSLIRRHVEAFKYLGGCPRTCLYDNMKTVVIRWEANVPFYNPRFLLFASHYGFKPRACRPRRPETKGKVERPFGYIKGNFLCGRSFQDFEHLKDEILRWLAEVADVRVHRTTRQRPIDRWEEERPHLLPLPQHHYSTDQIAYRLVNPEGLVAWAGNEYSVPQSFIGEFVIVKAQEEGIVIVSSAFKEIARHELRAAGAGTQVRLPAHEIRYRGRSRQQLDVLRTRFRNLSDEAAEYLLGLAKTHPRNIRAHLAHILELRQTYNTSDLVAAIKHALSFGAFDHAVVERILTRRAQPRSLEAAIANTGKPTASRAEQGRMRAEQRNAAYYQEIFEKHGTTERSDDGQDHPEADGDDDEDTQLP